MENLREELGDLLLQVVYHAQMADERQSFDFADVVEGVTTKMIRRHPHVFGDEKTRSAGMAKGAWDRIKQVEKRERAQRRAEMGLADPSQDNGLLDDVPAAMEPLMEALKLQKQASKVGFDWNNPASVLAKIREEVDEVEVEITENDKTALEQELGDLLFVVVNLARHLDIDPGNALRSCNRKFRDRFAYVENNVSRHGQTLEEADLETMEALWVEAKTKSRRSAK